MTEQDTHNSMRAPLRPDNSTHRKFYVNSVSVVSFAADLLREVFKMIVNAIQP